MDNVVWTDITTYGGYAVTANHELWSWGLSDNGEQPEKLLDEAIQVSSSNLVLTEKGELISCNYDYETNTFTPPKSLLTNTVQCSGGLGIKEDGTLWVCSTENPSPQKVGENVLYAAQGEQIILTLHKDGSLWLIDVSSDSGLCQETQLS